MFKHQGECVALNNSWQATRYAAINRKNIYDKIAELMILGEDDRKIELLFQKILYR